jgi:hypothetical protein
MLGFVLGGAALELLKFETGLLNKAYPLRFRCGTWFPWLGDGKVG